MALRSDNSGPAQRTHRAERPHRAGRPEGISPPADPLELRSSPRVGAAYPVQIYSTDFAGPIPGQTRDLSIGGACLASASPFSIKSIDRITLALPQGSLTVLCDGNWQREEPTDDLVLTGVSFRSTGPEVEDALWNVVLESGKGLARFLHENSSLRELGLEEAMGLAQVSRYRDIPMGRTIYRQHTREPGEDSIFLLLSGSVVLQVRVRGAIETEIARLSPGDLFGGMPLIADAAHAESAVASTNCRLLEIDRSSFRYIRSAKPWLGYRLGTALLRVCALRLRTILGEAQRHL